MAEETRVRSKGYMTFLIIFMGLIALLDNYLSLIETDAIPYIIAEFEITLPVFLLWQGLFGIVAFFVFILSWFADIWGRKIGILILILVMSISALLIGLIGDTYLWVFFIFYAILILGTNVNLWTIPISEESPAKNQCSIFNWAYPSLCSYWKPNCKKFRLDLDVWVIWNFWFGNTSTLVLYERNKKMGSS
ncbi:MAG: hypothetical protein ACTSPA_02785 [Promethearchaeota archaeon]